MNNFSETKHSSSNDAENEFEMDSSEVPLFRVITRGDSDSEITVVLLHGFPANAELWNEMDELLPQEWRIVRPDIPGLSPTSIVPIAPELRTMNEIANSVATTLKLLEVKKAVIVGHSLGGYVALKLLRICPDIFAGLCLFHSHPFEDSPEQKEQRTALISRIHQDNSTAMALELLSAIFPDDIKAIYAEEYEFLQSLAREISPEGMKNVLCAMRDRRDSTDILAAAEIPVLSILGKDDPVISLPDKIHFTILPARSSVEILPDVSHFGMLEAPELCSEILAHFVERCFGYY